MSIDKVQLQQQEVVDNGVVMTDVNPITSSTSVIDTATGSTMKETLDRVWNAVNSKLSRVVNSVNNRTGAVVINANDVGLGNVDNVSFNDIKEWVIEYVKSLFDNMRLRLYDDMQGVRNDANTNDQSLHNAPFFAKHGDGLDFKSYIGYFYWEDGGLSFEYRAINTIGSSDNSIGYDEYLGPDKDFSGGKIGVNIHPDEDALYVEHGVDKFHSGLRIDKTALSSELISIPYLYGQYQFANDSYTKISHGLLASSPTEKFDDERTIDIYVDGIKINGDNNFLDKNWTGSLTYGDLVYTQFGPAWYTVKAGNKKTPYPLPPINSIATLDLMDRQQCVGVVTKAPTRSNPDTKYEIKFYSMKTFVSGFGLKYYDNHQELVSGKSTQLGIDLNVNDNYGNMSALQAYSDGLITTDATADIKETNDDMASMGETENHIFAPWGWEKVGSGLGIRTDQTMSIYPRDELIPSGDIYMQTSFIPTDPDKIPRYTPMYYGTDVVRNWSPFGVSWAGLSGMNENPYSVNNVLVKRVNESPESGYISSRSLLTVNMSKRVKWGSYILLNEEPEDWSENFRKYYKRRKNAGADGNPTYDSVTPIAPNWEEDTYYYYDSETGEFILTLTRPDDWYENFSAYNTREGDAPPYRYPRVVGNAPVWYPFIYYSIDMDHPSYLFQDISGLRTVQPITMETDEYGWGGDGWNSSKYSELSRGALERLGIYDGKDAVGKEVDNQPYDAFSGGVSVNVGKFLEICPKSTGHANEYDNSGKVQVRIGKGLKEDIIYTDRVTYEDVQHGFDPTISTNIPSDWYSNPERFAFKQDVGGLIFYSDIPSGYEVLETMPDDWDYTYYAYYFQDPRDQTYHQLPKQDTPIPFEADAYYRFTQISFQDAIGFLGGSYIALCDVVRTNRIVVKSDDHTVFVNNSGAIESYPIIDWEPNKEYKKNQIIQFSNKLYQVISDFISGEGDEFDHLKEITTSSAIVPDGVTITTNSENQLGVRYGTSLTTTANGLEAFVDNITLKKNAIGAIKVNHGQTLVETASGILHVNLDNSTIKSEQTLDGALAVRHGTSLTTTDAGLEVKVDGVTIVKSSNGALTATTQSTGVKVDGSTLKKSSGGALYVDIDEKSLRLIDQGGRAAIGVMTDGTTIGLNSNNELCVLGGGGGGGGGTDPVPVDGTTIQSGTDGLYVNLDQETMVVNENSAVSVNVDWRTLQINPNNNCLVSVPRPLIINSNTKQSGPAGINVPVYAIFIDIASMGENSVSMYMATEDFTITGNYEQDRLHLIPVHSGVSPHPPA